MLVEMAPSPERLGSTPAPGSGLGHTHTHTPWDRTASPASTFLLGPSLTPEDIWGLNLLHPSHFFLNDETKNSLSSSLEKKKALYQLIHILQDAVGGAALFLI